VAILGLIACAPKAETKKTQQGPTEFGPLTSDVKLNLKTIESKTAADLFLLPAGSYYLQSSSEIFEFAETLLDLAELEKDESKKKSLVALSEKVRSAFYANPTNYTSFNQNSS